jgi:hypothetical protein
MHKEAYHNPNDGDYFLYSKNRLTNSYSGLYQKTILNADYKLVARIRANIMRSALMEIIHQEQEIYREMNRFRRC